MRLLALGNCIHFQTSVGAVAQLHCYVNQALSTTSWRSRSRLLCPTTNTQRYRFYQKSSAFPVLILGTQFGLIRRNDGHSTWKDSFSSQRKQRGIFGDIARNQRGVPEQSFLGSWLLEHWTNKYEESRYKNGHSLTQKWHGRKRKRGKSFGS